MNNSFYFKLNLMVVWLLTIPAFLYAQTDPLGNRSAAEEIETLLNTKVVTYAQASRFVLEAANVLAVNDPEEAFNYVLMQGWLPKKTAAGDPAKLEYISLLLMRSFDFKGGMMYSITKAQTALSAHYAYRELSYLNVILKRSDPAMLVSGELLLFYVNRQLNILSSEK